MSSSDTTHEEPPQTPPASTESSADEVDEAVDGSSSDEATEGESITLHAVERDSVVVEVDGIEFRIRLVGGGSGRSSVRHTAGGEFR